MKINIAEADYRAIGRESFSSLKHLLKSPQEFIRQKQQPFEGNAATRLGTAIHMFLQGEKDKVQLIPTFKKILKSGEEGRFEDKEAQQEWLRQNKGITGTDAVGLEICNTIYENARSNGTLDLLNTFAFEQAYLFERNGIKFKGRLDGDKEGHVIDIKTTSQSVDYNSFKNIIFTSDYDMQLAMYQAAHGQNAKCSILAVQTTYPYDIRLYHLSQKTLDSGYKKWDKCIDRLQNLDTLLLKYMEDEI